MDPTLRIFLFGLAGSAAVEVLRLVKLFQSGRKLPSHVTHIRFWVVRALLAALGGVLAVAYGIQSDILAVHVGASTPVILEQLARSPVQPDD